MHLTPDILRARLGHGGGKPERLVVSRDDLIPSAVLVPLVASPDGSHLLLTRRSDTVETHKGHIAFPGGMVDEEDRDRIATALRETREELGIGHDAIEIIDYLDDFATPTGFVITPVVGFLRSLPAMDPNPAEVAETFLVPVSFLLNDTNCTRETRRTEFGPRQTWRYDYDGRIIWGATAAIIRNLVLQLRSDPIPRP